jgi:plastocyanin
MKCHRFRIAALVGLFFYGVSYGADTATETGIVKGVITISGRPAPDAVVSIEGLPSRNRKSQIESRKSNKAVIDQKDLKFIPRVLPVLVGTTVEFPNHDKVFHNVYSASEAKKFDLGLYPSGETRSATFDKPGVIKILCNVHPNMEAYVVVKSHPYFSGADNKGNYQISAVPLGKYRLEVWHPDYGTRTVPFELVRKAEVLALNLDLKREK